MDYPMDLHDKENAPRGCLKLNDKIYPVYEGHNTIGRNPEAVINIKNISISQQHAVITVFDAQTHYISDFKSSNGTIVDNKKLNPLSLYPLNDGASIKFANVFCTYKKFKEGETLLDKSEESQTFSQSFYEASTQALHFPNSDEMILNEMPTQVIGDPTQVMGAKPLSIHEMPTQIFNFNTSNVTNVTEDNSSNDSIDFMTMQKPSESKGFALSNKSKGSDEEERFLQPSGESDIVPVQLNCKRKISDSERSTPVISVDKKTSQHSEDEEAPLSQIYPVRIGIKNGIDSDSDTEEDLPQIRSNKNKSKYVISDDDETDIEDQNQSDFVPPTQATPQKSDENSEKNKIQESSFTESFKLELNESSDEHAKDKSEKDEMKSEEEKKNDEQSKNTERMLSTIKNAVAVDHIYCRSLEEDAAQSHCSLKNDESNIPNQELESTQEVQKDKEMEESPILNFMKSGRNQIQEKVDDGEQPSTSKLSESLLPKSQDAGKDLHEESTQNIVGNEVVQPLAEDQEKTEDKLTRNSDLNVGEDDTAKMRDTFNEETQEIAANNEEVNRSLEEMESPIIEGKQTTPATGSDSKEKEEMNENDIFEKPTQSMIGDYVKEKKVDDIYFQPTQEISPQTAPIDHSMIYDDEIYLQPTQEINEISELIKSSKFKSLENDLSLPNTETLSFGKDENEDNISDNASSKLNREEINKEMPEEGEAGGFRKEQDFVLPLPPDKDDTFLPLPSTSKKSTIDDEELLLPPTQALEFLHKDDETSVHPDILPEKEPEKVEDQLEMLFATQSDHMFVATQQLVDVLEAKTDDIIEDSMIETNELKKPQFNSIESIREILDESICEDIENKEKVSEAGKNGNDTPSEEKKAEEQNLDEETETNTKKAKEKPKDKRKTRSETNSQSDKESQPSANTSNSSVHIQLTKKKSKTQLQEKNEESSAELVKTPSKRSTRSSKVEVNQEVEEKSNKTKKSKKNATEPISETKKSEITEKRSEKVAEEGSTRKTRRNPGSSTEIEKTTADNRKESSQETEQAITVRKTRSNPESKTTIKTNGQSQEEAQAKVDSRVKRKAASDDQLDKKLKEDSQTKMNKKNEKLENQNDLEEKQTQKITRGKKKLNSQEKNLEEDSQSKTNKKNEKSEIQNEQEAQKSIKNKKKPNSQDKLENKQENKENNTRSSKRKAESDSNEESSKKDSKTDTSEQAVSKKMKKGEDSAGSNATDKFNDSQEDQSSKVTTRKRSTNSEDDFIPKVSKTSAKKAPVKSTKKQEEPVTTIVETPTRKSARTRKAKFAEDEVISVSSATTSSVALTVISVPSSSSTPSQPTKRGRKLSANSRAMKNEKEKEEDKGSAKTRRGTIKEISPILATPERSKRTQKPKVAFTMMDNPELESLIRQLGGSVVDTVDTCTVLVTGNVKRSQKLLQAVGLAKPICSPQWLQASKKAYTFLDPWDYILEDEEAEQKWDFSLKESLKRSSRTKLLENYTFQVMVTTAADVLKGAIEACGGRCVTRNLAKASTDNLVIVASPEQKSKFSKVVKENSNIKVVEPEAIFDGTLRQEFRFDRHLLVK